MITVKQGDRYPITYTLNMDLTGATARVIAKKVEDASVVVLTATVTDAPGGVVTHTLTGDLDAGTYQVEVEVTSGTEIVTFPTSQTRGPNYDTLVVLPDLD